MGPFEKILASLGTAGIIAAAGLIWDLSFEVRNLQETLDKFPKEETIKSLAEALEKQNEISSVLVAQYSKALGQPGTLVVPGPAIADSPPAMPTSPTLPGIPSSAPERPRG